MAVKKGNSYINLELEYAEKKLIEWRQYLDANPVHELADRTREIMTKFGPGEAVVATIESQGKFLQETLKNYLTMLEVVDKLREKEAQKQINVRGDQTLSPFESGDID